VRGLVLDGVRQVSYRTDLPWPSISAASDAVVSVQCAGLCGSDLHPYEGREKVRFGVVPGHEAVGEVVAAGDDVRRFLPGDRVLVPFTTSCGACWACGNGLSSRCRDGALFGYGPPDTPDVPALHGGQAELLKVPLADTTLVPVPEGMTDEMALLLADNFPTGWYAAERAGAGTADVVVVVGLGAVGLCAVVASFVLGAAAVVAVDPVEERRRRAAALGAAVAPPDGAARALAALSEQGRAGAVIEAAGTPASQALAFSLVRPAGTLSIIAVQTAEHLAFPPTAAYDANVTLRFGRAPVRSLLDHLMPRLGHGLDIPVDVIVSHPRIPFEKGPEAYRRFAAREHGLVKGLFRP
jgi:threonine dehydrogenase-like Zn-dependent dehydrogenase